MMWYGPTFLLLLLLLGATAATETAANETTESSAAQQQDLTCPRGCLCRNQDLVDCRSLGLTKIPEVLYRKRPNITKLDLSHNDINALGPLALEQFTFLEELNLASNRMTELDPSALNHRMLKSVSLQSTGLTTIPTELFANLPNLQTLRLDLNELKEVDNSSLTRLPWLRHLRMDGNQLEAVPSAALAHLRRLEMLNLGYNKIKRLHSSCLENLSSLVVLVLDYNEIDAIDDDAFRGLTALKILELRNNHISRLPTELHFMPFLHDLNLANNLINHLPGGLLQQVSRLTFLELRGNPLQTVDRNAFVHLPRLQKLILSEVRDLTEFPNLNGTGALELIKIDRSKIRILPQELCQYSPHLRGLYLKSNLVETLPDLAACRNLRLLDLSHNRIGGIPNSIFQHLRKLHDLVLSHNRIRRIENFSFTGLNSLKQLDLSDNEIEFIHPEAFLPLREVQDINLGHNQFSVFPSVGLENVLHVKVHNNPNLRDFPGPAAFPRAQTLALSYAYHCCPFIYPAEESSSGSGMEEILWTDSVIFPSTDHEIDLSAWAKGETGVVDKNPLWGNMSKQWVNILPSTANLTEDEMQKLLQAAMQKSYAASAGRAKFPTTSNNVASKRKTTVQCIPEPSPFMPCQDLFDWWSLRCGVWIVFLMALLGNGVVVFVLAFARSKMDVPRFLVCNLAMADFFMGIYLGFLAVVDASTLGEFRMYAIPWQLSSACQVAGFLGVLSSELSVFTLAVITMERNYAITHAMHLNKRLSLRHASYIMAVGWLFAFIVALLPLVGVSDYRKFAVCLPFEVSTPISLGYVVFLMLINGVAFCILMGCYLKMYCAIRGSQAWNSNDSRIAKRMALLVFTDFLCWSPIAFFSLTAASGLHLISLEEAKIFTVFILPLNSCCNPFLYAILTKQFKKDCVLICKAIEESRVTRGIGRCRHSSNFSNRQTPGNTNSIGDRNSSKDGSSCQCQTKLIDKSKQRRKRWFPQPLRSLFNRIRAIESDLESSSTANEYAYQIAEVQQKHKQRQHHRKQRRAESVSSDNFSSSRSDSVKAIGCGIPMRIPNRRRNSWTVTRKTSNDSNLSSSRNDSSTSAMTASTSTGTTAWRNSRSSVSSDGGSSGYMASIRDRERLNSASKPKVTTLAVNPHQPSDSHKRTPSLRDKSALPTSPLAAGILRQQSVTTPTGTLVQRTVPQGLGLNPLVMITPSAGSKPKPRLTRQIAINEEGYIPGSAAQKTVSFDPHSLNKPEAEYCPLHSIAKVQKLDGVWESSMEEDEENDSNSQEDEQQQQQQQPGALFVHLTTATAVPMTIREKNRLSLAGFVPRKLSTISSRSCSVNPDMSDEQQTFCPLPDSQTTSSDCPDKRKAVRLLSKSDNDLYNRSGTATTSATQTRLASVANIAAGEEYDDEVFEQIDLPNPSLLRQPTADETTHNAERKPLLN